MTIISILIAIIIFGLLIFVHELGHFLACRLTGITVLQFTIGFGPALWKKQVGDTLYALRVIPLGGACVMKGADEEEELLVGKTPGQETPALRPADDEGSFYSASKLSRFFVCLAGPLMNLLCAVLILLIMAMPMTAQRTTVITGFMDGFQLESPQYFQTGDKIVNVNGFHAFSLSDILTALDIGYGKPYDVKIERNGKTITYKDLTLEMNSIDEDGKAKFGFVFGDIQPVNFFGKIGYAWNTSLSFLQSAVKSIQLLATGQVGADKMMGTVGIASEISNAVQVSASQTLLFVAFISINLAFMNLLPIPALDGGKIVFIIIEAVRGKPVSPKVESFVSMAGLLLILGLFVFVTYNDIARLIAG